MKKLLIQPCVLMVVALSALLTGCEPKSTAAPEAPTVSIDFIGSAGVNDVRVKFVPTPNVNKYSFAIGTEQDRDNFVSGDIVGLETVLSNEERVAYWTDLEPGAYYMIYAMAYDETGKAGPVSAHGFMTSSSDFVVSTYYVSDTSAGFTIKTTNDYHKYIFALGTKDDKEDFENELMEGIVTKNEVFTWHENYFDLTPDTDFVFYCKGFDRSGRPTKLFEIPIRTYSENSAEIPNFTFEEGDLRDFFIQQYIVTPNEACKQLLLWQCKEGVLDDALFGENNFQGALLSVFDGWHNQGYGGDRQTYIATNDILTADAATYESEPEQILDVYVVAYDDMYKPVSVKKFKGSVPPVDPTAALPDMSKFKMYTGTITSTSVEFFIEHDDPNTMGIYFDFIEAQYFDVELGGDMKKLTDEMKSRSVEFKGKFYGNGREFNDTFVNDGSLKPDLEYYIGLVAVNKNGPNGGGWGNATVLTEKFVLAKE